LRDYENVGRRFVVRVGLEVFVGEYQERKKLIGERGKSKEGKATCSPLRLFLLTTMAI
jgi:hypothetical protein